MNYKEKSNKKSGIEKNAKKFSFSKMRSIEEGWYGGTVVDIQDNSSTYRVVLDAYELENPTVRYGKVSMWLPKTYDSSNDELIDKFTQVFDCEQPMSELVGMDFQIYTSPSVSKNGRTYFNVVDIDDIDAVFDDDEDFDEQED
jgi:hypothetical protein